MKIEIAYFGNLRNLAGGDRDEMDLKEGALLRDLLEDLVRTHGPEFEKALDPGNSHIIFVNGQHHEVLGGLDTVLRQGDRVVFMPITMGG